MNVIYKHIISLAVFISLTVFVFNPIFFENKSIDLFLIEPVTPVYFTIIITDIIFGIDILFSFITT